MPGIQDYENLFLRAERAGDERMAALAAKKIGEMRQEQIRVQNRGLDRSIMQGATLGFGDEIESAMSGQPVEAIRGEMAQAQQMQPYLSPALELAGGLGTGAVLGVGSKFLGPVGRFVTRPTVPTQAAMGAGYGAAYGAGTATEGNRLQGAAWGAPLGAVGGGAAQYGLNKFAAGLRPGTRAEQLVRERMAADQVTPDQALAASRAGPELTLAETGGAAMQDLARTSVSMGGSGRALNTATGVLNQRSAGITKRVIDKLPTAIRSREGFWDAFRSLGDEAEKTAGPLYKSAYAAPFEPNAPLTELTQRGLDGGFLRKPYATAKRIALYEGKKLPAWQQVVNRWKGIAKYSDDPGAGGVVRLPGDTDPLTLETWDWVKRGLDAEYKSLVRKSPDEARALWIYRQKIVDELDSIVPEYKKARAAYAGPRKAQEALQEGRKVLKQDYDFTEEFVSSLSQNERDAFVLGAARSISDKLKNVVPEGGMPRITQLAFERIRPAFSSQGSYNEFVSTILKERGMQAFKNEVLAGSHTARIQASQEAVGRSGGLGQAVGDILTGDIRTGVQHAVKSLLPPRQATLPPRVNDPLSDMLFSQGPQAQAALQPLRQPVQFPLGRAVPPMTTMEIQILLNQMLNPRVGVQ